MKKETIVAKGFKTPMGFNQLYTWFEMIRVIILVQQSSLCRQLQFQLYGEIKCEWNRIRNVEAK